MPKGIYQHKPLSEKHKENISNALKGRVFSEEHRNKLSLEAKRRKRKPLSFEHKRNIGNALRGQIISIEARRKSSKTKMGHVVSIETRKKISQTKIISEKTPRLEKHWAWEGGGSFEPYPIKFNESFKEKIRRRDNYICQECNYHQDDLGRKLDVHHIDYDKKNCKEDNLISLCGSCHSQTNFKRNDWIKYFQTKLYG